MASLREIADCNGTGNDFQVVRDFFGYQTGAPGRLSLLRQMQLLQGYHVHLNLIRVGIETFTESDEEKIDSAVAFVRDTCATVDFGVGNVGRRAISADEAGGFQHIGSDDEAVELTREFAVDNAHIDVFFVRTYAGLKVGSGPLSGPLDKNVKGDMTGIVLALEGSTTVTGFALAQLVCRYLGLGPHKDASNLMSNPVPNGGELTARQGARMPDGRVVFFACDDIEVIVLTGGHLRRSAQTRQARPLQSNAGRLPVPSLRLLSDPERLRRAAHDHDQLRAVALGATPGEQRARAVAALAASDDPRRVQDLESICRDGRADADVRHLSATLLGRIDTAPARAALLALLDTPGTPAGAVAQSLGRTGERAAFDALARATAGWTGVTLTRARFAMRLIAHRCDLYLQEPEDAGPEFVTMSADDMRDVVWRPSNVLAAQIALRSLAAEPFGIELDSQTAQMIRCGRSQLVFLLNRSLGSPLDIRTLQRRKTIAGIVARQSPQRGLYDASMLVLTTPRADGSGTRIACYAPNGTLVLAGSGAQRGSHLAFECRSVRRRGAYAARIAGDLGSGGFTVTSAKSGRLLRDVARP